MPSSRWSLVALALLLLVPSPVGAGESGFTALSLLGPIKSPGAVSDTGGPPATGLPYVNQVIIGPHSFFRPLDRPICTTDSILVRFIGTFPTPCYDIVGVAVLPSLIESPFPAPPIVRLTIKNGLCDPGCQRVNTPWETVALLPPLPFAREYSLITQLVEARCPVAAGGAPEDAPGDSATYQATFPFVVSRCDSPGVDCVSGDWVHPGPSRCDDVLHPDRPSQVTFTVQSSVALAGIEGEFHVFDPSDPRVTGPPLAITDIEPIGVAAGMRIAWTRTTGGALFKLFAENGAPIPGSDLPPGQGPALPVLRLSLRAVRTPFAANGAVSVIATNLLGATDQGTGVPECHFPTLAVVEATICYGGASCDFNGDGLLDIRDLVLMVRCLGDIAHETGSVAVCDSTRFHDCNADGRRDLEDVICCALEMLREHACPGCTDPPSGPPTPDVGATLGTPRYEGNDAVVPLRVTGWEALGGTIMRLRFPADRYDATVETAQVPGMLDLSEAHAGEAALGFVRLGEVSNAPSEAATIRLRLKPGASHGGSVSIAEGEFSDLDGQPLGVRLDASVTLGGPVRLALSQARPNPSSGEMRFDVTLDRAADVRVAVFDLAGRKIATLHEGQLGAGANAFVWNGTKDGGTAASSGIYFLRATTLGTEVTRKVIRMRP